MNVQNSFGKNLFRTKSVRSPVWRRVPGQRVPGRVPRLLIGDCADSLNISVQRCTTVSAIDVTAKTLFERLYLISGLSPLMKSRDILSPDIGPGIRTQVSVVTSG